MWEKLQSWVTCDGLLHIHLTGTTSVISFCLTAFTSFRVRDDWKRGKEMVKRQTSQWKKTLDRLKKLFCSLREWNNWSLFLSRERTVHQGLHETVVLGSELRVYKGAKNDESYESFWQGSQNDFSSDTRKNVDLSSLLISSIFFFAVFLFVYTVQDKHHSWGKEFLVLVFTVFCSPLTSSRKYYTTWYWYQAWGDLTTKPFYKDF